MIQWGAVCAASLFVTCAQAETVTLTANEGELALTGTLRNFDGRFYQIETQFGMVTVAGERVYCTGAACPGDAETTGFSLTLDRALGQVLVPALINAFAAQQGLEIAQTQTDATHLTFWLGQEGGQRRFPIRLRVADSAEAFADLAAYEADMALTTRGPNAAERMMSRDAGQGDLTQSSQELLIGLDALVLASAPGAAPAMLSDALLAQIAAGTRDWADLGQPGGVFALHARGGRADLSLLMGNVVDPAQVQLHPTGSEVAAELRARRGDLGILPYSMRAGLRAAGLTGPCGLAVAPNRDSLSMGEYPFLIPAIAYLPDRRLPRDIIGFIAFLRSDMALRVIERAGFARPGSDVVDQDNLASRVLASLQNQVADAQTYARIAQSLTGAKRLALGFPVSNSPASARLLHALSFDTLAEAIQSGTIDASTLILAGFGAAAPARALADRLSEATQTQIGQVMDFGPVLPIACPDRPWADQINHRVEIWSK